MGSLALLAKELGHQVTGSDQNVYPPMSTQLQEQGIELIQGYDPEQLEPAPDLVIVGNAISRGNPCVEAVLDRGLPYTSGPQWLHDHLLKDRWVLAVSGTHGKTTTATMLAWILEYAGMKPGYLIGGVPLNFDGSARVGKSDFFVIEADEYDTAFFDKRSKFVHYAPRTLIINNLEFDHADIFADLAAIQTQFHHLIRILPQTGCVIAPLGETAIDQVLARGIWSDTCRSASVSSGASMSNADAWISSSSNDGSEFELCLASGEQVSVNWSLQGDHNVINAMHAMLAARHVGVTLEHSADALAQFKSVKRRMECLGVYGGVTLYDDFAHHPTAIETTLKGLRARIGNQPLVAVIEPRSNTMKQGVFQAKLGASAEIADVTYWYQPAEQEWSLKTALQAYPEQQVFDDFDALVSQLIRDVEPGTHLVIMSNGGFDGIHTRLKEQLEERS